MRNYGNVKAMTDEKGGSHGVNCTSHCSIEWTVHSVHYTISFVVCPRLSPRETRLCCAASKLREKGGKAFMPLVDGHCIHY